ncbi:MAG TPA: pilus assembly protein TadG-related protein [Micromonosporaceae bacterium]|nr:pilus assembly protein TadG-related protein [Micromonosporaceae bacterium]
MTRDRGSVSILFAAGLTAIIMIIGLSVDGGGRLRAAQRAQDVAAEAARAGGQAVDVARVLAGGPRQLDPAAAETAVQDYLRAAGATGSADISDDLRHVTVHVTLVYHTRMLSLVGIATLTVAATATAALVST